MAKSAMDGKMNKKIDLMHPFVGGEELEVKRVSEVGIKLKDIQIFNPNAGYPQKEEGGSKSYYDAK